MFLSYEDALARILESTHPISDRVQTPIDRSDNDLVLAEDVTATSPNPRFDNSSVDGYAIHGDDLHRVGEALPVAMIVAAGEAPGSTLDSGSVARIFTGAQMPIGTSAVAMQEDVIAGAEGIMLQVALSSEEGVRRAGSDFTSGTILAKSGKPITPGMAGLLASQGLMRVSTFRAPKCLFVTTGDEIVSPETEPGPTQVRDVIGTMLGLASAKYCSPSSAFAPDDPNELASVLENAAQENDVVIVAGGASIGDRDYVARVVAELGEVMFHGVNIRPGKPLLFGKIKDKPILCLPGNPASSFVCFHLFGIPLLRRLGGWSNPKLRWFKAAYGADHEPELRDVFARVTITEGIATPIHEQASFGLRSLGAAEGLVRLPAETATVYGNQVDLTLL